MEGAGEAVLGLLATNEAPQWAMPPAANSEPIQTAFLNAKNLYTNSASHRKGMGKAGKGTVQPLLQTRRSMGLMLPAPHPKQPKPPPKPAFLNAKSCKTFLKT